MPRELDFDHDKKKNPIGKRHSVYDKKLRDRQRYKGAIKAKDVVKELIRKGLLKSLTKNQIVCSHCDYNRATVYDRRDYRKPEDVNPVCYSCNKLLQPAIDL